MLNFNIWRFSKRYNFVNRLHTAISHNCAFTSCSTFPASQSTFITEKFPIQNRKISISFVKKGVPEIDEDGLPIDYKTNRFIIAGKRVDQFLAKVLGVTRTSLEKIILQGSVRVNEEIITKRAYEIDEGDDIEVFIQPLEGNDKLAITQRVLVVECQFDAENGTGYNFKTRFWREYITDNWKNGLSLKQEEEDDD